MNANNHPSVLLGTKTNWDALVVTVVFLGFGVCIGVIFGASYRDLHREVAELQGSVGDLSIRTAALERGLADTDHKRRLLAQAVIDLARLGALAPDGKPYVTRGWQPAVPGQDLSGMTIPPGSSEEEDP